jgi:hypothetical protein
LINTDQRTIAISDRIMTNTAMQRFTQRARFVLTLALEAAERQHSPTIDTSHILIGLIREPGGAAGRALRALGLDTIIMHPPHADTSIYAGAISLAPDVKRLLEIAVDEARTARSATINTEHLLLALLRVDQADNLSLLARSGITPDQIHAELASLARSKIDEDKRGPYAAHVKQTQSRSQTNPAAHHIELLMQRISRRNVGPNITLTSGAAFVGYFMSAIFVSTLVPLVTAWPWGRGIGAAGQILGWSTVIGIPPLVAVLTSMVTVRDIQQGTPQMLALTNLSSKSILWGYVRGMLYRFRLYFVALIAASPLFISGRRDLLFMLFPLINRFPAYLAALLSTLITSDTLALIAIPISLIWFAITVAIALAFKSREPAFAAAVSALLTLIMLLVMFMMPLLGMLLMPDSVSLTGPMSALGVIMPVLVGLAGLLAVKLSERWVYSESQNA